jgi:hypothetical protein
MLFLPRRQSLGLCHLGVASAESVPKISRGACSSLEVPSVRDPVQIEHVSSPSSPTASFSAFARANQSTGFDGVVFQFSGTVHIQQDGNSPFTQAKAYHYLNFDITGQSETVTLDLTALSMVNYDLALLPGLTYGVIDRTTDTYVGSTVLSSPQTLQGTLPPGSYRLEAGVFVYDQIQTIERSATFADTISLTNLSISPGAFQTHPLIAASGEFSHVPGRSWFDPPTATEFEFQMTDAALFTQIMNLPTGFDALSK